MEFLHLARDMIISKILVVFTGYETYLHDLRREMNTLLDLRYFILDRVDHGRRQGEEIRFEVSLWLREVEDALREAEELQLEAERQLDKQCLGFCCKISTKIKIKDSVKHMLEVVDDLKKSELALQRTAVTVRPFTLENSEGLEIKIGEVLQILKNEEYGMIAICGEGGTGKTTLMKEVHNQVLNSVYGFDVVIWVKVSKDATTEKVQNSIWRKLGLSDVYLWEDGGEEDIDIKAAQVYNSLTKGSYLLLLDDVWEPIDLWNVGIPDPHSTKNKSNVIFTTRCPDKVSLEMGAQKEINLEILEMQVALSLFERAIGGQTIDKPEFHNLAKDIVEQSKRSPLAIAALGRALADKGLGEWKYALEKLKQIPDGTMESELFEVIKFSFHSLPSDTMKRCFLYCCLFPEEFAIDEDKLIDYWIGEDFLKEKNDEKESGQRYRGYGIIQSLVDATLLMRQGNFVRMHDLAREVAVWIISQVEEEHKFLVQAGNRLREVPSNEMSSAAKKVSMIDNLIDKLPQGPIWPDATTLLLAKNNLYSIPDDFFGHLPRLTVLDLSYCWIELLPRTIIYLVNLTYLNLSHTNLTSLPLEIGKLQKLEVLDLSYAVGLNRIPPQILSSFQSLQVLNCTRCGSPDSSKELDSSGSLLVGGEAFLEELERLHSLSRLAISIKNENAVRKLTMSPKLQGCINSLSIEVHRKLSSLDVSSIQFMKNINLLVIHRCWELAEFEIEPEGTSKVRFIKDIWFYNLGRVHIKDCWMLRNLTWLAFAPNLQSLRVEGCMRLEEVIGSDDYKAMSSEGRLENSGALSRLKHLFLCDLPELKSIISTNDSAIPCLETLTVLRCFQVRRIPVDSKSCKDSLRIIKGQKEWWKELEWNDSSSGNDLIPYFIAIY